MREVLLEDQAGSDAAASRPEPLPTPRLLVELPSWPRVFFVNLGDLIYPRSLPPLDTRSSNAAQPQKADPEFSRQPIISVPPEADNHSQTIVSPPKIKLQHDVPLPNIVAWSNQPQLPIAPAPLVPASSLTRLTPQIENSVVAPPPDVRESTATAFQAPQPAIIDRKSVV